MSDRDENKNSKVLVQGFEGEVLIGMGDNHVAGSDSLSSLPLRWYCSPDSWQQPPTGRGREGCDGSWKILPSTSNSTNKELHIWPPAKKDFWRQTYYQPLLVKDDGPVLYATLPLVWPSNSDNAVAEQQDFPFYTVTTDFSLTACRQFDQAGLCIRLHREHWIKAGIEVVDGTPRLSCVVTNVYSDWSTQTWSRYRNENENADSSMDTAPVSTTAATIVEHVQLRIHCRGTSFVVESKFDDKDDNWEFIRIAHCSPPPMSPEAATCTDAEAVSPAPGTFWAGCFACSPEDQRGGHAIFHNFVIQEGSHMEHNADGNHEESGNEE